MAIISSYGMHHLHKRKQKSQNKSKKLAKYPHPNPKIKFFEKYITVVATVGPLVTIPQIWKIYSTQNAMGVSFITFSLIAVVNISWLIYGLIHKEKPIIITNMLFLIANISICIGSILYG